MALIGVSIIVASVVLFCLRRPAWLPAFFKFSQPPPRLLRDSPPPTDTIELQDLAPPESESHVAPAAPRITTSPPPPPAIQEPPSPPSDEQSTPKATPAVPNDPIPSLSLSTAPPTFGLMAPPPRPAVPRLQPQPQPYARAAGSSTLPLPNRGGGSLNPLPNRTGGGGGGLAPPPTHTTKPAKPSKEVALAPGHSPLDWARLSSSPHADLAGVGGSYLRVTPSMLKRMTGRRGKDAWTVLGGRVYNVTPYVPFHPGGGPELLRGAGRDGTKLFGEVHPWVNYEGMLAACLVGVFVAEEEGEGGEGGGGMEDMD
ncbi:cytochrome b5 reductase 4 [Podospora conica]|nr:cytochrome b5 reductase 4 [Schizothecium conicum]